MTSLNKRLSVKATLLAGLSILAISAGAKAQDAAFNDAQKDAIKGLVREYIIENPEIIAEAMTALRSKQEKAIEDNAKEKIGEYKEYFKSADLPYAGNKDGDIIVVEFFDYNCGYCKKALPDVLSLIEKDKNVKVVFMEMPILGPTSLTAAQWAMAAQKQGKYFEFHQALMEHQGQKNETELTEIASKIGLDVEQMKKDAASTEIQEALAKKSEVSQEIGVRGTPAFVVGDKFIPGYIGEEALLATVKEARTN